MKAISKSIRPVVVLAIICLLSAALLAALNEKTTPIIEKINEETANETYFSLIPDAGSFTELECDIDGVTAVMKADNGSGYVITAQAQGYGGEVPAAVAFSTDGTITAVQMMDNEETPGLGQKVKEEDFYGQFAGWSAQAFTIDDIDAISGATISSKAAVSAINLAIEAYQAIAGGEIS